MCHNGKLVWIGSTCRFQSFNILLPTFSSLQIHKLAMKISRFSQDKIKGVINHISFIPLPICTFFNLKSQGTVLIKFYIFESKVSPSIFSSQIFLNKSKLYLGKHFVKTQFRLWMNIAIYYFKILYSMCVNSIFK